MLYFLLSIISGLIGLGIYFLKNPEKIDKWSYLFNKYILWWDSKRERKLISSNLDYKISTVAKKINKEADGILPYGIRIKWRSPDEVTSFVQKNEVVVVLRKNENSDINIIEACLAFVPKALLPKARNVVEPKLIRSVDHYVVKKFLSEGSYDSAYNYYMRHILDKVTKGDSQFEKWFNDISKIDEIGFFTRVLLEEFRRLGSQLYGTSEERKFREETKVFLEFLSEFHKRRPGDFTKLIFNHDKIKLGILFIAKKKTLNQYGMNAYLQRIKTNYDQGIQRQFVFSYAQRADVMILDDNGYVQGVKTKKDFESLNEFEKKCRDINYLKLIKKQKYFTRDVNNNLRSAKYLLYEFVSSA